MGNYINPVGRSKEEWLEEHATHVRTPHSNIEENSVLVCLVFNGGFTAAAVCNNPDEIDAFNQRSDPRAKLWMSVPRKDIHEIHPEFGLVKKGEV